MVGLCSGGGKTDDHSAGCLYYPRQHLMGIRRVSQRARKLHNDQDSGTEDPYPSQTKSNWTTANDWDFYVRRHWVTLGRGGVAMLDWPLHWDIFKRPCDIVLGIVTELFSTSEKIYFPKTWISGKHIDLLLLPLPPEGDNLGFTPIFLNALFHWLPGDQTDTGGIFLFDDFLCIPLISVQQRVCEHERALRHQVFSHNFLFPRRIATACCWVILPTCTTKWASVGSPEELPMAGTNFSISWMSLNTTMVHKWKRDVIPADRLMRLSRVSGEVLLRLLYYGNVKWYKGFVSIQ